MSAGQFKFAKTFFFETGALRYAKDFSRKEKLAYLAGLADGEGSFIIKKGRDPRTGKVCVSYMGCFSISMTDRRPIELFQKEFGTVGSSLWINVGTPRKATHKTIYTLQLSPTDTALMIKALLPYLVVKRKQAILVLDFFRVKVESWSGPKEKSGKRWTIHPKYKTRMDKLWKKCSLLNGGTSVRHWEANPCLSSR